VPGGFIGFGDDALAARYFEKALAVDPDNINNNFFLGEFLLDQGDYARARAVLEHALAAPAVVDRPVLDAGRREEIRASPAVTERKSAS
jgi:Tfp pilus assembly protein PilF